MKTFVKKSLLIILLGMIPKAAVMAQHHDSSQSHEQEENQTEKLFGKVLKTGSFEFHLRSYFMATVNQASLTDYATWGTGAGIGYFSPRWKRFGIGFSGFFVFRHFEKNLKVKDPATGSPNRYEITLFDVQNIDNHKDMDRLEELFISYQSNDWKASLGRQKFESPLINEADNRLRPNLFSGILGAYSPENWNITAAWLTHAISRGSLEWLSAKESIGFYPTGRNPLGVQEDYRHQLESKGIGVVGIEYAVADWEFSSWNYLAENIFGLAFMQATGKKDLSGNLGIELGAQGFYQQAVADGGNPNSAKAYILPTEKTHGVGLKLGLSWPHSKISLNYLGISDRGRFLLPREWGRERFFVSQQRERFEGMGGVNAVSLKIDQTFIHDQLMVSLGSGYIQTPDLENLELNKYGLPNYLHFTGVVDYRFKGYFKGLDLLFLVASKKEDRKEYLPQEYIINRVNMSNFNVILDYKF